jgi:GNAT superfamily N-acetyltransferase
MLADRVTLRVATESDLPRIAELIFGDPLPEDAFIFGETRAARHFLTRLAQRTMGAKTLARTTLAELDGSVVGLLQTNAWATRRRINPLWLLALALRSLGWRRMGMALRREAIAARTRIPYPDGIFAVDELFVDPPHRGSGIGGMLLREAETQARTEGFTRMALVTTTANPARRLYERHGFVVTETRTNAEFERLTGIEGRVLMIRELPELESSAS